MVRNNKGGKHGKKMARKHVKAEQENEGPKKARIPTEEGEFFACSTKLLGNGMVLVVDLAGNEYICVIRKKFKGRGKRRNTVQRGTWLLAGKRLYEGLHESNASKKQKCDLLEVYNDKEKELIRKQCPQHNWNVFDVYSDAVYDGAENEENVIEFINTQADRDIPSDDDNSEETSSGEEERDEFGNTIREEGMLEYENSELIDINSI
jgi:hypothetical protein